MPKMTLNGRDVEILEQEFEFDAGCYVIDAQYIDDGSSLTEKELLELETKYQEELYQDAYESAVDAAHDLLEDR